jgi:Ca2+/H+ antiporter
VFGLLLSLVIIIASVRSEEEIPMSGVIFGVVMLTLICVGVAAAYGAIKKKMKKPDQVQAAPISTNIQ